MKKILLLSDTHSYIDDQILKYTHDRDEIWHAGDIGGLSVLESLEKILPTRAVYGNIDNAIIRRACPLNQEFEIEGLRVFMTHIGGYPGRYTARVKAILEEKRPNLYVCGHSHILKVVPDRKLDLLHMNPGACGVHGFHKSRTMLRFDIEKGKILNLEAIDLGLRGKINKT